MTVHTAQQQMSGYAFKSEAFSSLDDFMRSLPGYDTLVAEKTKAAEAATAPRKRIETTHETPHHTKERPAQRRPRLTLTEEERQALRIKKARLRAWHKRMRQQHQEARHQAQIVAFDRQRTRDRMDDHRFISRLAGTGCSSFYARNTCEYMWQYSKGHIS